MILLILSILTTSYIFFSSTQKEKKSSEINSGSVSSKIDDIVIPVEEVTLSEAKLTIVKPKSWHKFGERSSNGYNYYFTPYKYEDLGLFKRGLSITIIKNVSKTEKVSPNELALSYIKNSKTINPKLKITKVNIQHLKGYRFQLEEKKGFRNSMVTSFFFVSDDRNDMFYSFIFQYEKSKWNMTYPIRRTIFRNIKFLQ